MSSKLLHSLAFLCCFASLHAQSTEKNEKRWWKETVFYQIYMPSYADSNDDGYGDFKGITAKLDYLHELGIKGIWLTPFLKSPKVDNGYDVSDYYSIDPVYGSMADFRAFLEEAHKRDIKVIMDMVFNHTSTECKWFQEAKKSKDNPYRDYYIWKDKPNNWESFFGGSAWEFDEGTKQYYYHKFDTTMADLNWSNPKVISEAQNIIRFWLNTGIDGFRLDVINFLTTVDIMEDNPIINGQQHHINDIDQPGVKNAMKIIKATVNEYGNRFIVGEIGSDKIEVLKQYQSEELMDVVFNFNFGSIPSFSAEHIFNELVAMENNMKSYPTLFFGSHDMPRMINRLANGDIKKAEALTALVLTAKGIPFMYYGDEIGMNNIIADGFEEIVDIQAKTRYNLAIKEGRSAPEALVEANKHNRDRSRSPMQWNKGKQAGFSKSRTWIKINPDYVYTNVESLIKDPNSILNRSKKLIALRNSEEILQYGTYEELRFENERIQFTRIYKGKRIIVIINFGISYTVNIPLNAKIHLGQKELKQYDYIIYSI